MNAMAAGLSDDDLRTLGALLNKMPAPPPAPALTAAEEASGADWWRNITAILVICPT